jgi:hypothetical protein
MSKLNARAALAERRIFTKSVFRMTDEGTILVPEECESFIHRGRVAEAVAYMYRMPQGIPGDLTRPHAPNDIETQPLDPNNTFPSFGVPGKIVSGLFRPISANADPVYGALVRSFPATGPNASDPLGTAVPPTAGPATILRKGYMAVYVQLGAATCALGSAVYIRYQNAAGGQPIGGIEGATSGNNYAWPGAQFMGPADASGYAEISFGNANV